MAPGPVRSSRRPSFSIRRRSPQELDDSKRLSAARREALFDLLLERACVGIGEASVAEISALNILQASFLAMRRAIEALTTQPAFALVDGNRVPAGIPCPARAIVGGDGLSPSIAAASIVAKVTRDRLMLALAREFPGYGWETNVGYGTSAHADALARLGVTPHHRPTFGPIHKILQNTASVTC